MLNIKLPKTRFNTTTYPSLEERADGAPIPIAYGDLHNIVPVCINTVTQTYKTASHAIHSIDAVYVENEALDPAEDYTTDLADAEFTILSTPYLAAATLYYFVVEADYAASATEHLHLRQYGNVYADGSLFKISDTGAWTAAGANDLHFKIYGKKTLDGATKKFLDNTIGTDTYIGLRDTALPCANYRLAQSFLTGATAFYCTKIEVRYKKAASGVPVGNLRIAILSAYNPAEVQVGAKSEEHPIDQPGSGLSFYGHCFFPLRDESATFSCDIEGAEKTGATIVNGADMLEDLVVTRLGKALTILEPTALANFKAKRTQAIKAYIDRDMTFGEIVGKLESSLLFKFIPLHDGTYAPTVYEADTVEVRPHFFDEHFLTFSMRHDFSAVKAIVKVKYDEDPAAQEFKVAEADSDLARFVYGVEDTLEVETYLKTGANAATLAADYLGMYETSPVEITFEIRGYGLNLIPGRDKVKITRTRAAYAGGTINGVLFRIVKITKKPGAASTEIIAIQDDQTY